MSGAPAGLAQTLDLERIAAWLPRQRWYQSKSRQVAGLEVEECVALAPSVALALVHARQASGSRELYQLLPSPGDGLDAGPIAATELVGAIASQRMLTGEAGTVRFVRAEPLPSGARARAIDVQQSHSSFVLGDETVLKVLRRLEPGVNPELELLRFLTAHGFANIAPLQGWYEYEGRALECTLGVAQRFVAGAVGGWELALDAVATDPDGLLAQLAALGTVTARLHNALGCDPGDPAFSPEEPSAESLSLLTATIDEDIERIFARLPDDERLARIAGRGQDVRERMSIRGNAEPSGRLIRTHGDYHLGQALRTPLGDWVLIDFEGEPARPLHERRQKRSALRDVASMLRSFAYVVSVAQARATPAPDGFEQAARDTFLERYLEAIDPGLLPAGDASIQNLLAIYELEKAIYELQYELENRPDWLPIPAAGIARLLESA